MNGSAPANWYPDPNNAAQLRYWDGHQWTDHYAPAQSPAVEQKGGRGLMRAAVSSFADGVFNRTPKPESASFGQVRKPQHAVTQRPMPPHGTQVEAWSEQTRHQDIVGESHHVQSFAALAAEHGYKSVPDYGVELAGACAVLVHEPDNPYDSDAVAVWVDGRHLVGHLPRAVNATYVECLRKLSRGTLLRVPARVWVGYRTDDDDWDKQVLYGSVSLRIPEPDGVVPFNDLPDEPHVVLPWGKAINLSGEELHMDVLKTFMLGSTPRHVAATLHVVEEQKTARSQPKLLIEARLDGQRVGTMSPAVSDQVRDLVSYVQERGHTPVARAVIKGSDLRADVTVHVARTTEVPQSWLDGVPLNA